MANRAVFQVEGLSAFLTGLKVAPSEMKSAEQLFLKLATKSVIVRAKDLAAKYAAQNGVYKLAARDISASGIGGVKFGGKPWDMGAEYGAIQYHQFQAWKGNGEGAGYFFWPAVTAWRDENMTESYFTVVLAALREAFPD